MSALCVTITRYNARRLRALLNSRLAQIEYEEKFSRECDAHNSERDWLNEMIEQIDQGE